VPIPVAVETKVTRRIASRARAWAWEVSCPRKFLNRSRENAAWRRGQVESWAFLLAVPAFTHGNQRANQHTICLTSSLSCKAACLHRAAGDHGTCGLVSFKGMLGTRN
jgi:hypothetical protein